MALVDSNHPDEKGKQRAAQEENFHLDFAQLAAIREAMMEELGPGRMEALPLDDGRGRKGAQKAVGVIPNKKNVRSSQGPGAENAWNGARFDDVRQEDLMLDSIQGGQAHRARMTENLIISAVKNDKGKRFAIAQASPTVKEALKNKQQQFVKQSAFKENVRPAAHSQPADRPTKVEILERFRDRKAQKQAEFSRRIAPAVQQKMPPDVKYIHSLLSVDISKTPISSHRRARSQHPKSHIDNKVYEGMLASPESFLAQVKSPAFGFSQSSKEVLKTTTRTMSRSVKEEVVVHRSEPPNSSREGILIDFGIEGDEKTEPSITHAEDLVGLTLDEVADTLVDDYAVQKTMEALQRDSTVLADLQAMLHDGKQAKEHLESDLSPRSRRVLSGGLSTSIYATAQPLVDNFLRSMSTFGALGSDMAHAFAKDMTKKIVVKLEKTRNSVSDAAVPEERSQDLGCDTRARQQISRRYTVEKLLTLRQHAIPVKIPNQTSWSRPSTHVSDIGTIKQPAKHNASARPYSSPRKVSPSFRSKDASSEGKQKSSNAATPALTDGEDTTKSSDAFSAPRANVVQTSKASGLSTSRYAPTAVALGVQKQIKTEGLAASKYAPSAPKVAHQQFQPAQNYAPCHNIHKVPGAYVAFENAVVEPGTDNDGKSIDSNDTVKAADVKVSHCHAEPPSRDMCESSRRQSLSLHSDSSMDSFATATDDMIAIKRMSPKKSSTSAGGATTPLDITLRINKPVLPSMVNPAPPVQAGNGAPPSYYPTVPTQPNVKNESEYEKVLHRMGGLSTSRFAPGNASPSGTVQSLTLPFTGTEQTKVPMQYARIPPGPFNTYRESTRAPIPTTANPSQHVPHHSSGVKVVVRLPTTPCNPMAPQFMPHVAQYKGVDENAKDHECRKQ